MTRGRKPEPTAKKQLKGNPGKRALNKREPKPTTSPDAKLKRLLAAAAGADSQTMEMAFTSFSERYLPLLKNMRVLTDVDMAAFELMAVHYAIAWRAAEIAQRDGLLQTDKFMQVHKHPILQVLRDNSSVFRAFAGEFGMTPSARSRIEVRNPDEDDELERYLFGSVARDK